jgi:CarD family transcriptional regulator
MQARKTQFHIGDWLVHAFYGIGKIIDQEKMKLSGKSQTFFTVKLKDGKYWLSKEKTKADHIRPLASESEIADMLQVMKETPQALPKQYRSRKKQILDSIESGSLRQQAELIRDLHSRRIVKKLSFENRNWLAKLKKQFIHEWSLVSGRKKRELKRELEQVLKASVKQSKEK